MDENQKINQQLKYDLYGRTIAYLMMLIIVFGVSIKDARDTNSKKVQTELNNFKASQPNYTDSIRAHDAQNADDIAHLKNILDFLKTNSMPRVNQDSLNQIVVNFNTKREHLVDAKARTDRVLQAHLDSVRQANRYNILVRNSAIRYSK